jgi:hypothetical protein
MALGGPVIAFLIVTVAGVARQDEDTVGAFLVRLKHELRVNPAATHHADDSEIRRAGQLSGTGLVSSSVGAPVAQEADEAGLERLDIGFKLHNVRDGLIR